MTLPKPPPKWEPNRTNALQEHALKTVTDLERDIDNVTRMWSDTRFELQLARAELDRLRAENTRLLQGLGNASALLADSVS